MNRFNRVKVRGTGLLGTVIDIENNYATVALDDSTIEMFEIKDLEVINSL